MITRPAICSKTGRNMEFEFNFLEASQRRPRLVKSGLDFKGWVKFSLKRRLMNLDQGPRPA